MGETSTSVRLIEAYNRTIRNSVNLLQDVRQNGRRVGPKRAYHLVTEWLANFDALHPPSLEFAVRLLENLELITESRIHDAFCEIADALLASENVFIAPLGEVTESSFRLTARFNTHVGFRESLPVLLAELEPTSHQNRILFFDDFLNSGGQLASTLFAWFQHPLPAGATADEYDRRTILSKDAARTLRRAQLHFFFFSAQEDGIDRTYRAAEEVGLDLRIHSYIRSRENLSLFGNTFDVQCVELGTAGAPTTTSVFKGYTYIELQPFYELLSLVGEQLLRSANPHWPETKVRARSLGYGQSGKLWITETNVPTCTVPAIWLGGPVQFKGATHHWAPLFTRTKKVLGPQTAQRGRRILAQPTLGRRLLGFAIKGPFFGREEELSSLRTALLSDRTPLCLLIGPPGVGKTYLWRAVATSAPIAAQFRRFAFVDCRATVDVIARLKDALDVPHVEDLTGVLDALRSEPVLVVLENLQAGLSATGEPADPLLADFLQRLTSDPPGLSSVLIVTTRTPRLPHVQKDLTTSIDISSGLQPDDGVQLLKAAGLSELSDDYLHQLSIRLKGVPAALTQAAALINVGGRPLPIDGVAEYILSDMSQQLVQSLTPPERDVVLAVGLSRMPLPLSSLVKLFSPEQHRSVAEAALRLSKHFLFVEFTDSDFALGLHDSLRTASRRRASSLDVESMSNQLREYYVGRYETGGRDPRFLVEAVFHAIEAQQFDWAWSALKGVTEERLYRRGLIRECSELLETIAHVTDDPELPFLHGLIEQTRGKYDTAQALYTRAAQTTTSTSLRCRINHQLATIERMVGHMTHAKRLLISNIGAAKHASEPDVMAKSMYQLAIWLRESGRVRSAGRMLRLAARVYGNLGSRRGSAKVAIQSAKVKFLLGEWMEALELLTYAEQVGSDLNDPDILATVYHQVGNAHHYRGTLIMAEQHYTRAKALRERLDDIRGIAAIDHQMAVVRLKQGAVDQAATSLAESERLWQAVSNIQGCALNAGTSACIQLVRGRADDAHGLYYQALSAFETLHDRLNHARLRVLIGRNFGLQEAERSRIAEEELASLAPGETPARLCGGVVVVGSVRMSSQ